MSLSVYYCPNLSGEMPSSEVLTIKQLSAYLMVSEKTLYRMLDRSLLPAIRVGAQWRFRKSDIDAWLDVQVKKVEIEGSRAIPEELEHSEIEIHPLLNAGNIWLEVPPLTRDELLLWMITRATLDQDMDRYALYESILARERICSTALVDAAAFPHPNEPSAFHFTRKRVLVAVTPEPVNFSDPHGHEPRVIVMILARTMQGYLLTISRAIKLFGDPQLIGRVTASANSGDVIRAIRDAEARLKTPAS
jgi:excisionase family DNA binding protein